MSSFLILFKSTFDHNNFLSIVIFWICVTSTEASDYRILLRRRYADISDNDLDVRVRRITQSNRSLGQRMVQGFLQTEGVNLPRRRIAESLIRVDEAGVVIRWCRTIRRRSYQVSGPNALWHVDGNHKLIRRDACTKLDNEHEESGGKPICKLNEMIMEMKKQVGETRHAIKAQALHQACVSQDKFKRRKMCQGCGEHGDIENHKVEYCKDK
ncbi:unnamed protein product [Mytilus edulis]|uniref:Uncharacterized protein n=1 Tax=Mytilus edulis TaxID=6550 RepID=A0A8S3REF0_MYTED|nr:unnamed protein product [Mytilus edulis]